MRAALDGRQLDRDQLKVVIAEHDELQAKLARLTDETKQITDRTQGETEDRIYASAIKRVDEINRQCDSLLDRARRLQAHPQVHAVIVAREAKEAARS